MKNLHFTLIVASLPLLFAGASYGVPDDAYSAKLDPLMSLPFTTGGCVACEPCGEFEHKTVDRVEVGVSGSVHGCESVDCSDHTEICGGLASIEEMEAIRLALLNVNPDAVNVAMGEAPSKIVYVASRSAIQILGCNDQVIAHLPLTPDQLALLE